MTAFFHTYTVPITNFKIYRWRKTFGLFLSSCILNLFSLPLLYIFHTLSQYIILNVFVLCLSMSYTRINSIYICDLFVVAVAQARRKLLQYTLNVLVIFIFVISGWKEVVCDVRIPCIPDQNQMHTHHSWGCWRQDGRQEMKKKKKW